MSARDREIIQGVIQVLTEYAQPERIYLFGSRGKGKGRKGSDFDFAVAGAPPSREIQVRIEAAIEEVAGLFEVDIAYLDDAEPAFRDIVLKSGKIIYERGT